MIQPPWSTDIGDRAFPMQSPRHGECDIPPARPKKGEKKRKLEKKEERE